MMFAWAKELWGKVRQDRKDAEERVKTMMGSERKDDDKRKGKPQENPGQGIGPGGTPPGQGGTPPGQNKPRPSQLPEEPKPEQRPT